MAATGFGVIGMLGSEKGVCLRISFQGWPTRPGGLDPGMHTLAWTDVKVEHRPPRLAHRSGSARPPLAFLIHPPIHPIPRCASLNPIHPSSSPCR